MLSAVIQDRFVERRTKLLVFYYRFSYDLSARSSTISHLQAFFRRMEQTTLDDFLRKNDNPCIIEPLFDLNKPYVVLAEEEAVFSGGGWDEFYRRYPGSQGCISVSRVGFNTQLTQAVACVGIQQHWRRGYGSYYLVEKTKDKWQVKRSIPAWRS